jgi:hypothetical protein
MMGTPTNPKVGRVAQNNLETLAGISHVRAVSPNTQYPHLSNWRIHPRLTYERAILRQLVHAPKELRAALWVAYCAQRAERDFPVLNRWRWPR